MSGSQRKELGPSALKAHDLNNVTGRGANPLAPTRLTFFHADDTGSEDPVPSAGLGVSGQGEGVVGRPQDVDPFEHALAIAWRPASDERTHLSANLSEFD